MFRVILLLFMWYTWPKEFCSVHDRLGWGKYVGWYNWTAIAGVTVLNFMWYRILLKKFIDVICGKKERTKEEEKRL